MGAILSYIVSNLPAIIGGISTYGPIAIKLIENNQPAIKAVAADVLGGVETAVASGLAPADALKKVLSSTVISLLMPHKMTAAEEAAWMDRATPHNDPSQENSNVGSG